MQRKLDKKNNTLNPDKWTDPHMPQSGYSTAYSSLNPLLCKGELKAKHVLDIILYFYSKRTNCVYSCNQSAVFVTFNTLKTESCASMQLPYIKQETNIS